jgi:dGTPase
MNWSTLLNSSRVRALHGGELTHKLDSDLRSEFERDYGRAVFSTPVRRLNDKAQVFPLDPNDGIRTRLT